MKFLAPIAGPWLNFGRPEGIGTRVHVLRIQAGDEVVRQRRSLRAGQVQRGRSNLNHRHEPNFATTAARVTRARAPEPQPIDADLNQSSWHLSPASRLSTGDQLLAATDFGSR